jgi:hypothetical protein
VRCGYYFNRTGVRRVLRATVPRRHHCGQRHARHCASVRCWLARPAASCPRAPWCAGFSCGGAQLVAHTLGTRWRRLLCATQRAPPAAWWRAGTLTGGVLTATEGTGTAAATGSGRATSIVTGPGAFFSGRKGLRVSSLTNGATADYLRFCAPMVGYTTASTSLVAASSAALSTSQRAAPALSAAGTAAAPQHRPHGATGHSHVPGAPGCHRGGLCHHRQRGGLLLPARHSGGRACGPHVAHRGRRAGDGHRAARRATTMAARARASPAPAGRSVRAAQSSTPRSPGWRSICGATCSTGCQLPTMSRVHRRVCSAARTAAPAGTYTASGDACNSTGYTGSLIAGWSF